MTFADQSHINHVREALWRRNGGASVMIGAGFSRNATPSNGFAKPFPLWSDITQHLCTRLYPSGDNQRLQKAIADAAGISGLLRLAQEYEAAFGSGPLNDLIKAIVPDEDYVPNACHIRLLKLPWRDVFTTNWDTLLERTRVKIAGRPYSVVRTQDELASATSPRIIKLHGTFPAHTPFIFTEEHYRSYPKNYAPFVNTVQQAMMETTLLLLGFSGEDPNFLHWSGWVRDTFGKSAPKIYLAGWLDLSPHRRRMLEQHNVVPIDLAHHPKAELWPENLRHGYSTEWVLYTLEHGRKYDISDWPSVPSWQHMPIPAYLEPIERILSDVPVEDGAPPTRKGSDAKQAIRDILNTWQHNRRVYPGWLVLPPSKRHILGFHLDEWEHLIIDSLSSLGENDRVNAIRELLWRRNILLDPISEELEISILSAIEILERRLTEESSQKELAAKLPEASEIYREFIITSLRCARERFDPKAFQHRVSQLEKIETNHPDISQWLVFEKCLKALHDLDYATLDVLVRSWVPLESNAAWMIRRAGLLAELDQVSSSIEQINTALSIIRNGNHCESNLIAPSLEGWGLLLAAAYQFMNRVHGRDLLDAPPAFQRWEKLAAVRCDALTQKKQFIEEIRGESEKDKGPLFDLGARRSESITFSNAGHRKWLAARRGVRLCDFIALPPGAENVVVASDVMQAAVGILVNTDYPLTARLTLRIASSDDDGPFNKAWSRSKIAAMRKSDLDELTYIVNKLIDYSLPIVKARSGNSEYWVTKLLMAIEALSRLALRMPSDTVPAYFSRALLMYRIDVISKNRRLHKPMKHLLFRTWEAMPISRKSDFVLDILGSPIVGLDGFDSIESRYIDPGELLLDDRNIPASERTIESERSWKEAIDNLVRALRSNPEARERAIKRVIPLLTMNRLTEDERRSIAVSIWECGDRAANGIPIFDSISEWTLAILPEVDRGRAIELLHDKWMNNREIPTGNSLNSYFKGLGHLLAAFRNNELIFPWSGDDAKKIEIAIERWSDHPYRPATTPDWNQSGTASAIRGLSLILPEIDLSQEISMKLFKKADTLNQTSDPAFRLLSSLARLMPQELESLSTWMRMGLSSDNANTADEALIGLHRWLIDCYGKNTRTPKPPVDIVKEIGVIIATRRRSMLNRALQLARTVFTKGPVEHKEAITSLTVQGLKFLLEELKYTREHDEKEEFELPLLRWGATTLAIAMFQFGLSESSIVNQWLSEREKDPLPEVRHADLSLEE